MSEVAVLHELTEDYNLVVLGDDVFDFGKHVLVVVHLIDKLKHLFTHLR